MSRPVRRVLFVSGSGASSTLRYRVRLAEEALRSRGVSTAAVHFTDPLLRRWTEETDLVALYRTPATRRVLELVLHARTRLGIPVTFDTDDFVFRAEHLEHIPFLDSLAVRDRALFEADVVRRGRIVPFVDRASGSTSPIADELRDLTTVPVDVLPNGISRVGQRIAELVARRPDDGRVRVGYFSGSATHDDDWQAAEPAVVALLRSDPRVDLWVVGPLVIGPSLADLGDRVVRRPAVPWSELPALLAEVDINLAPLDVTPFTVGKSALKWMESALVGIPTIATATPPFRDAIDDGATGLLVEPGGDWSEPLARLVEDRALRLDIGERARAAALSEFDPERQADRYLAHVTAAAHGDRAAIDVQVLRRLAGEAGPSRTLGLDLEAYPFPAPLDALGLEPPRGASVLAAARPRARSALGSARRGLRTASRTRRRYTNALRRRLPHR